MRAFNSFQLVSLFAGTPFLLAWVATATFPYAPAAFWAVIVAYVIQFGFLWYSVWESMEKR